MDIPLVSVITATKNEEKVLGNLLETLKNQTYANLEIIVVDNNSTDRTKEIAARYTKKIFNKGPERSTQRNFGARKAKGKYLLFLDADMELTPRVVGDCIREMDDMDVGAVIVPEVSVGEGFWAKCKALEKKCYIGDETIEAARFFKREVFFKVKGYDKNLIAAEDWDLSQRVKKTGFSFARINSLIRHHEGRLSLIGTVRKKYTYGKTISRYVEKHKEESKKQLTLMRPAFLRNYKQLLKSPVITIGLMIMKTCEFGAGAAGFAVAKIRKKGKLNPESGGD